MKTIETRSNEDAGGEKRELRIGGVFSIEDADGESEEYRMDTKYEGETRYIYVEVAQ